MAYGHTHPDIQVRIVLFAALGICIDDINVDARALEKLTQRLLTGSSQLHHVLDHSVDNPQAMSLYFLPYAAAAIVMSTVQFVSGTLLDQQTRDASMAPQTVQYVNYKREKNGVAEAFGFMVWNKYNLTDLKAHNAFHFTSSRYCLTELEEHEYNATAISLV